MSWRDNLRHRIRTNLRARKLATGLLPRLARLPGYRQLERMYIRRQARYLATRLPEATRVQTTTACNARCRICARSSFQLPAAMMADEVWTVVLERLLEAGVRSVDLQWFGEPFLDPKLLDRMCELKRHGLEVYTFTNGSLLSPATAVRLIEAQVDHLNISIDGFSREVYEDIRRGLVYEEVLRNALFLLEERRRRQSRRPTVAVCLVKCAENAHEVAAFSRFWAQRADQHWIANARNMGGLVDIQNVDRLDVRRLGENPCRLLWTQVNISALGDVVPCCDDIRCTLKVGSLMQQSLREIWSGEPLARLRRLHLEGRRHEIPLCAACSYYSVWW